MYTQCKCSLIIIRSLLTFLLSSISLQCLCVLNWPTSISNMEVPGKNVDQKARKYKYVTIKYLNPSDRQVIVHPHLTEAQSGGTCSLALEIICNRQPIFHHQLTLTHRSSYPCDSTELEFRIPATMSDPEKKCSGADCDKNAGTLQCPTCLKQGVEGSYFCAQDCFKRNWVGDICVNIASNWV